MKQSIFDEQTSKALKQWHKNAVKKKTDGKPEHPQPRTLGGGGNSLDSSPGHSPRHRSVVAKRPVSQDKELMNMEGDAPNPQHNDSIMVNVDLGNDQQRPQPPRDLLS